MGAAGDERVERILAMYPECDTDDFRRQMYDKERSRPIRPKTHHKLFSWGGRCICLNLVGSCAVKEVSVHQPAAFLNVPQKP